MDTIPKMFAKSQKSLQKRPPFCHERCQITQDPSLLKDSVRVFSKNQSLKMSNDLREWAAREFS